MIRLGLCCIFRDEPIKFRHATAKNLLRFERPEQLRKLSEIALHNATALLQAVRTVKKLGIGAFRVLSQVMPLRTHPEAGYELMELPDAAVIISKYGKVKRFVQTHDVRLSFHPDQFIILSSPREDVVRNSIRELEYQSEVAELIGAENVNIHMGGVYGDKAATIKRFIHCFPGLPELVRKHLTLENDDLSYTVNDLYPVCRELRIPLIYDVHHHRCNPDSLSVAEATEKSIETWNICGREPHFHISSPKDGWGAKNLRPHHDYIDIGDFPDYWKRLNCRVTIDVEAKAKELAVKKLALELADFH